MFADRGKCASEIPLRGIGFLSAKKAAGVAVPNATMHRPLLSEFGDRLDYSAHHGGCRKGCQQAFRAAVYGGALVRSVHRFLMAADPSVLIVSDADWINDLDRPEATRPAGNDNRT
jgi:hypothetical protein